MNAYETLGVSRDADERAIKRAYISAVKVSTPEKDPERFKLLREAYEILLDPVRREAEADAFGMPAKAKVLYDRATSEKCDDAVALLETALSYAPENLQILLALSDAYLCDGFSGKAVALLDAHLAQYGNRPDYLRAVALAYHARGWCKKAETFFVKCLDVGGVDAETLSTFLAATGKRASSDAIISLTERRLDALPAAESSETARIWAGFICAGVRDVTSLATYLDEHPNISYFQFFNVLMAELADQLIDTDWDDSALVQLSFKLAPELATDIAYTKLRYLNEMNAMGRRLVFQHSIKSFESLLFHYAHLIFQRDYASRKNFDEPRDPMREFDVIDAQMEIIDKAPRDGVVFRQIMLLCPLIWSHMEPFITRLQSAGNRIKFKERFLIGILKEASLPLRNKIAEMVGDEAMAYFNNQMQANETVRVEAKPGRNDPCPCGSGKKYKKCCGKEE